MKKATMFVVGALMIAVLGSMSVPAEAPAEYDDEFRLGPKHRGQFLEAEENDEHSHPAYENELLYVGSNGGLKTCCGACPDGPPCPGDPPGPIC